DIQRLLAYFKQNEIGYYLECNHGTYADHIYRDWFASVLNHLGNDFDASNFEAFTNQVIWIDETTVIKDVNKISFASSKIPYDAIHEDLCNDFDVIRNTIEILEADSGEISLKGVTKAQAIALVINHLGLNDAQVMAIGDSDNDIEMLEYADIGIAMSTASEKVKSIADELTKSPKDDSIYECFVKHGLIDPQQ
ncbi:MAG: HAD hydrolase family protein, partial [Erysipelotrichaceae bacterium]|nr:HAD hydrolase family protein [Erysipelotrichaceae bacterium]